MEIGTKIKKLRELKNFTQEHVANSLSMTPSGYGKIERNETEVSYHKLEKIAEVLGIKVEDIINFNESMVFNVMHNQTGNGYVVNHISTSENEKSLYELIISQQKEEIENLRKIIEKLQDK
ncbi:helix-turn-helix domain-containing protein [Emticicia fluvialis]|uniref:helix-turn-helix domain-containing protein n=1 Tax=Emticicia fluvialis TaxID=2974474 RepID=UPI002165B141|nr:helix-turn-helix transcriptional regulator [Emticicia fluvialis]